MKSTIVSLIGLATLSLLPACSTTVETPSPSMHHMSSTTTATTPATYGTVQTRRTTTSY